jgi:hypothetical protein
LCILVVPLSARAESEIDLIAAGQAAFFAWRCAATASFIEEKYKRKEELFSIGHQSARIVIEAMNSGDLTGNVKMNIPGGLLFGMTPGPNVEFQLGALWARIEGIRVDFIYAKASLSSEMESVRGKDLGEFAYNEAHDEILRKFAIFEYASDGCEEIR